MSYTPEDFKQIRFTAALELMRFKVLCELQKDRSTYVLRMEDVNEILVTAGLPVIVPDEVNAKEIAIIKTDREEKKNDTL